MSNSSTRPPVRASRFLTSRQLVAINLAMVAIILALALGRSWPLYAAGISAVYFVYTLPERLQDWSPPRPTLNQLATTNIVMVGVLMALLADSWLAAALGAGTILFSSVRGLNAASQRLRLLRGRATHLEVVLACLPVSVALLIAAGALAILAEKPEGDLLRLAAVALFTVQVGVIFAFDMAPGIRSKPMTPVL